MQTYPAYEELFGAVYHVMEDDKGNLWFATKGDGLVKLTPDVKAKYGYRFQRFKHNPSDNTSLSGDKSIIPIKIAINVFGYVHLTVVLTCCMNRAGALLF